MKKTVFRIVLLVVFMGNVVSQAQTVSGQKDGHNYVDLELPSGTFWATCNVGAAKPTEYGSYFAWGETSTKKVFSWSNYKWSTVNADAFLDSIKKYNTNSIGVRDSLTQLEEVDDAAVANWGDSWGMPTYQEMNELIEGCYWKWTRNYKGTGVAGRIGTSKTNGNVIFLPATGVRHEKTRENAGYYGYYWTTSLLDDNTVKSVFFNDYEVDWGEFRDSGVTVRAVVKSK